MGVACQVVAPSLIPKGGSDKVTPGNQVRDTYLTRWSASETTFPYA